MRRDFSLPEEDLAWLEGRSSPYELVRENGILRVVLNEYAVPAGYDHQFVRANVRIDPGYPDAQIDMVYFYPGIALMSHRAIAAVSPCDQFDGQTWQRWSRHRTGANPWRPGLDNLGVHFELVQEWLTRELRKT
jgi:hypothetical protein